MLIIRGVNMFPSQVEELILKEPVLAPHYRIEVSRPGKLDEVDVLVEMDPGQPADEAARAAVARHLQHEIKTFIGVSTRVRVLDEGSIERSIGKAKRVVDTRPK